MLALKDHDIPVIEISEFKDLQAAYDLVTGPDGAGFKWVVLDSFTEIAEVCLTAEKKKAPDPRQAYGETQDRVFVMLRKFRDLIGKDVYFICKQTLVKDDSAGTSLHAPMMPGNALKEGVSYHFDEVFALRQFDSGKGDGSTVRMLQTGRDLQFDCKDRSGSLSMYEPADLASIKRKIMAAPAQAQEVA